MEASGRPTHAHVIYYCTSRDTLKPFCEGLNTPNLKDGAIFYYSPNYPGIFDVRPPKKCRKLLSVTEGHRLNIVVIGPGEFNTYSDLF